uniref:UPF0481 protein At3g47200-like n=1 Tax=Erigeron canadensis TaxID=72917 RepID=UPI001CB92C47|nr:UPF0481 protein At3g47200-like [Erigeron canadensis]
MEFDPHESHSHASEEIVLEEHVSLISSIKMKMANTSDVRRICRVSDKFYEENEDKYFPQVVSIGPFHHGKEKLKAMEQRKWQYLTTLLSRVANVETRLGRCVEVLKVLEERARKCYGEDIQMNSDEFVEMLLIDGCFIIELFYKSCCKGIRRRGDPFLSTYQVFHQLRHDMVLLENQIPFFVLQHLFNILPVPKQCGGYSLVELAFRFFKKTVPEDIYNVRDRYGQEIHHLLDLIHQSFIPNIHILQLQPGQPHSQMNIPTVTQLLQKGSEIRKSNSRSVLEVKFNKGILRIPALAYHDLMEAALRNLVAMENCCYDATKYITSYVFLMRSLVQSNEDAKVLQKKGILDKGEELVAMLSKISVNLEPENFYYGDLSHKLNNFATVSRSVWYARKVRNCVTHCVSEL